ncbi:MAG: glycosyltransferase family 39 protein [Acidobacteria bacterium]|nr:glycosyltransferase family 39 protein [Acidobacteriota bacterium]
MTWLCVTIGARVAAVGALPFLAKPAERSFATLSGGDALYMLQRSIWIRNALAGQPFAPRDYFEAFDASYGWSSYNYVLAAFHTVFGPSPYAAHLASTVLFFAGAVLMFRLVRAHCGPRPALIGLLIVTVLPTLFVWSMSPLKEAPYFLLAAIAVWAVMALRARTWNRGVWAAVAIVAALLAIRSLRYDAATLTAAALAVGVIAWLGVRSRWAFGLLACGAVAAGVVAFTVPAVTTALHAGVRVATNHHIGHVLTPGHSFRLLGDEYYVGVRPQTLAPAATAGFVVRSVVRFFTVPEPWILRGRAEIAMLPQQMLWYVVIVLAAIGARAGLRRDPLLTCVLGGFVITGALLIGVNSGNIGTLIRHRDTIVPFAVWLSAVGASQQIERGRSRININRIDAWAGVFLLALPIGALLYLALRTPAPRPDAVEPRQVYAPGRVVLRGRHLKPYLHAYLVPHGQALVLLDRHDRPPDAAYLIKNPNEAELDLPSLPPGVYDVALLEAADLVARLDSALTVVQMASPPVGVVFAEGRFQHLDARATAKLTTGTAIRQADGTTAVDVVRVGRDTPQIEPIGPGVVKTWARIDGQTEREGAVRVRCQVIGDRCWYAGQPVVTGGSLALPFAWGVATFVIDGTRPEPPAAQSAGPTVEALVDFVTFPESERTVKVDDRDTGSLQARPLRPARIVKLLASERFVGDAALAGPEGDVSGGRLALQQPLVRIRAVVRFARAPSGSIEWRSRPLAVGDRFTFETPAYRLDGAIVGVTQ